MIELSTIRDLVAIFGVIAGFSYYVLAVRANQKNQELTLKSQEHATETRQIDIYMRWQLLQTNPEWMQNYNEVHSLEWEDFEDFARKHSHTENPESAGKRFAVWSYWNGLGYLLSRGVIDSDTMYDMMGNACIGSWIKFEPIIQGFREHDGRPETWRWFEYLADEMKKVRDKRGMGEYTPSWRPSNR